MNKKKRALIISSLAITIITSLLIGLCVSAFFVVKHAQASEFDIDSFLNRTYVKVGAGYKFHEPQMHYITSDGDKYEVHDPYSARIEVYYQYSDNVTFGISHHSQWATGAPFNDDNGEYYKTEIFIDYTFNLGDLL